MDSVTGHAARVARHPALKAMARSGFVVNGLLHLVIAGLTLAVLFGAARGSHLDQSGALALVAGSPGGAVLLALMTLGLTALSLWHLCEAVLPGGEVGDRVKAGAKTVAYGAVAFTTGKFALGNGSSNSSRRTTRGFTATLMDQPAGRVLVVVVGLAVIGVGGYYLVKGLTRGFQDDLTADAGSATAALGVVGHAAKGVALGAVGVLFVVAALQHRPRKAAGLDAALRSLNEQPFGSVLLGAIALGLAAFGLYCLARARFAAL